MTNHALTTQENALGDSSGNALGGSLHKAQERARWRGRLLVLLGYTLLTLGLTWPLVTHLTTHTPGIAQWAFDESTFLWNIWYLKASLVDHLQSPLHSELIWYPLGIDLVLYTYNFFHALIAQPLMLAFNLPLASNVALLLSTILSGYGVFLLVRTLLTRLKPHPQNAHQLAAFSAGALYAFASNRAIYAALGHYDMVTTQWIPFYALMLLRALDLTLPAARRRRAALLAGIFFAFTGLAEMITALFLGIFTLIVLAVVLGRRQGVWRQQLTATLVSLLVIGVTAAILWGPVLAPILTQFLTNDFSLKGWGEAIPLSVDLLGWFTPTVLHPLWGGDLVRELRRVQELAMADNGAGFRDLNTVFLGWVSLGLALLGAVRYRRTVRIWLWTALIFGLFTLGPFLQINGRYRFDLDGIEATIPLPFAILHYLPIIKANRAPNRNSVLLMLGLAVLAGYGVDWLLEQFAAWRNRGRPMPPWRAAPTKQTPNQPMAPRARKANNQLTNHLITQSPPLILTAVLTAAMLFEHLAIPAPLTDARIPAVYNEIVADPRPVSVLQTPLGWRDSFEVLGPERTQLQYYQTLHGKPMLGGNISRAPAFKLDYFRRIPFFQALVDLQFGRTVAPETLAAAQAQATDLMYLYNTGYVLLYPPIPERYPYADTWQATWDFVKATLPLEQPPFWTGDGIEAYRVVQPTGADHFTLDLGVADALPYRGEGWDESAEDTPYGMSATWATATTSRLFVPLRQVNPTATYTLRLQVHPFAYPGGPPQRVQATITNGQGNEWQGESYTLTDGWQEVSWAVPGRVLVDSLNHVDLQWAWTARPRMVLGGDRQIGSTGKELPLDADLNGFAEGGFMALFTEAGDQLDASAGRRGVNVTVLADDGAVLEKVGFDTAANGYESEALAQFLATVAPGRIVLVVSSGDATAYLSTAAVDGLRRLGADVTLDQLQGQHFALVGVQGAAPGSAAVEVNPDVAFLRISLPQDRRTLAAAVDWVRIEGEP
ncbi:MAG: interleukin-like EMT inducer domain-containing protein [Caldilineaceae bacterium]